MHDRRPAPPASHPGDGQSPPKPLPRVRPARLDDGPRVSALAAELSAHEGQPAPYFTDDSFRRDGFGNRPAFSVLVAELEGQASRGVVGYALFYPGYDVESATRGGHLADLYVVPAARRLGVGHALMAGVARRVRQDGGRWLSWLAYRGNSEALAFYDKLGANRPPAISFDMGPQAMDRMIRTSPDRPYSRPR